MSIAAIYYDGQSARRYRVSLDMDGNHLRLSGDIERSEPVTTIHIPATLGNTPRIILFNDGARCEITDHAGFAALLQAAGYPSSLVAKLESRWGYALGSLAALIALAFAGYLWGLPFAAEKIAYQVPHNILAILDRNFLDTFDDRILHPSTLPVARQQALSSRLEHFQKPPDATQPIQLLFRNSETIGPNAFALSGGSIVILDQLIELSDNDDEILGVLAHEMGHVNERHGLQAMLLSSVTGAVMAWYLGDISIILATAPTILLHNRYSREFERHADSFAAKTLTLNHIPPSRLGDMLEKLQKSHKKPNDNNEQSGSGTLENYLSSHPATPERIKTLQAYPDKPA